MSDERTRSTLARVLGHSPRIEDRQEAEKILRELRDSAQIDVAHLPIALGGDVVHERPRRDNAALTEMTRTWMGLRSPMHPTELDHRFERWFADAEQHPALLEQFAPRMVASVTDWLGEYERVSGAAAADDEPCLRRFDTWAKLAARHPAVAAVIAEQLSRWSRLRSQRTLAVRSEVVEAAMRRGELTAAKNELREIERLEEIPEAKIAELREKLETLEIRVAEIDAWCNVLTAPPTTWSELLHLFDLWAEGRRLAQVGGTPRDRAERIDRTLEHLRLFGDAFIRGRVGERTSLDELRSELVAIRELSRGRHSVLDATWLEPVAAALVRLLDQSIEAVEELETLRRIETSAASIAAMLPAGGGRQVQEAIGRIEPIAAAWDALTSEDLLPAIPGGVIPSRLARLLESARRIAARMAAAREAMQRGSTLAERMAACLDAIAMLEEIQTDAPQRAGVSALLDGAFAKLEMLRMDEAIERWDIAELRSALGTSRRVDTAYGSLLDAVDVLDELAALRRRRLGARLDDIASWWAEWRAAEMKLPGRKPESLGFALEAVRRDVAASARAAIHDYVQRTTSIDEDRDAEAISASLAATLPLREEVGSLTQRRMIHAAVVAARARGPQELASLLRDSWGTIDRYLPWSSAIVGEAFERAWDAADDEALDLLRDVALLHTRPQDHNERFRHWLDWLEVERTLSSSSAHEDLRRLQAFLQREGTARFLVRRLARLVEVWRGNGDDAVLVWASRVFRQVDPPLFPGVDPLLTLLRRTEEEVDAIFRACRETTLVDSAFLDATEGMLKRTEGVWQRLDQLLLDAPAPSGEEAWVAAPPRIQEAKKLLAAFRAMVDSAARWARSDLRPLGTECDVMRSLLRRELAAYPASEALERVLRKVEPLTRMEGLERFFRDACQKCNSDAPAEATQNDLFLIASRKLDAIVATLRATEPESSHTYAVMSEEYRNEIPDLVGDLLPRDPIRDLESLRRRLLALQENDVLFADAIAMLWRTQPNIGTSGELDPDAHRAYVAHYPSVPPASMRTRRRFDDFAARSAQRVILYASRSRLPEWLQRYVDDVSRGIAPW